MDGDRTRLEKEDRLLRIDVGVEEAAWSHRSTVRDPAAAVGVDPDRLKRTGYDTNGFGRTGVDNQLGKGESGSATSTAIRTTPRRRANPGGRHAGPAAQRDRGAGARPEAGANDTKR